MAARSLGKIGNEAAVTTGLVKALSDNDSHVRRAALDALGNIGNVMAIDALQNALHHEDSSDRECAVMALERIGDQVTLLILINVLGDGDEKVREAAVTAVGKIGGVAVTDVIQKALKDENDDVRHTAAKVLGDIGVVGTISALQDVMQDEYKWVRGEAVEALGKIGDAQILAKLTANFRRGVQIDEVVPNAIKTLQERFKVYQTDLSWLPSTGTKFMTEKTIMRILRVVLASPSDVQPERDVLPGVIDELNRGLGAVLDVDFKLYRWETDAYPGFHPEGPQGMIDGILQLTTAIFSSVYFGSGSARPPTMPIPVRNMNFVSPTKLGRKVRSNHVDLISWSISRTRPIRHPRRKNSISGVRCWNSRKHFPSKAYGGLSRPLTSSRNWYANTYPAGCGITIVDPENQTGV